MSAEAQVGQSEKYNCPQCGSTNTQRLSITWKAGSSKTATVTIGAAGIRGIGAVGIGHTAGTVQTDLSKSAAPPKKALVSASLSWLSGIGAIGALVGLFMELASVRTTSDEMVFLKWGAIMVAAIVVGQVLTAAMSPAFRAKNKAAVANTKEVNSQKQREWDRTFHCLRCDARFIVD